MAQSFTDWTSDDESCKWIYPFVSCNSLIVGNTRLPASEKVTPPLPPHPLHYASSPFDVIDRCCSLFIWSGFNNMKPIARSGACCCLYGPLSVSCPLYEKWEREREGEKADESEMCYILWEEAKWKQGNLKDQYRAESTEPAGWSENTKQAASPLLFFLLFSLLSLFFLTSVLLSVFI